MVDLNTNGRKEKWSLPCGAATRNDSYRHRQRHTGTKLLLVRAEPDRAEQS